MNILLFSLGAAIGAPVRFFLDNIFRPKYKFPIGIFISNIFGSLAIGMLAGNSLHINNYLVVGFCGALTTWSTFIVDVFTGFEERAYRLAALNLLVSLVVGVLAYKFGFSLHNA